MKKIFYSLLAVAALASCVKSEAVFTEDNSEIKIKPATTLATKANVKTAIDGTEYPTAENFDVYGYWKDEKAGSTFTEGATLYLGLEGAVEFKNKGNYWGGAADTYYWPKNGSLRFAAYSPSSVDMLHDLATDTYTVDGYYQPNETAKTWDLLVAPTSASYTAMTAAENVSVVFEHALSWITVKMVAKDAAAAKAFDVKKVTIDNVVTTADLAAVMSGADKAINWTLSETKAPVVVFEGSQAVTAEPTVIETTANGTLVIPQPTTTITVDYTQNALPGTPALEGQKVTVDLVLDKEDSPWKPGKHYVYTLVFGLDEILINPDVVDWEDEIVNDIEVGTTNVYSVAQLEAALAQGGKIVLQESLEVASKEKAFLVSKDAVLDLNGKTIAGADNQDKGYALIEVQPDVTFTVEGSGTLTAKATNNRYWNAYSSVISNQRGTLIVNEGVVIEHLGGTDMAYGIDNLTNTGAQPAVTIVNGATVKSTYRAIRQFLNSTTGSNELYVNKGSKIEGANRSIWSQNANNKANPGKTVVEAGAELKGDVMLSASNAPEWPVEVSIAASALVDGATVVPSNVPAGYAVVLVDGVYTVVKGATGVATAEQFAAAVKQTAKDIEIILNADIEVAISTLGQQTGGSGEYKLGGEETENFTIDLNGHKLTITTNYWSNLGAKNDNALFTIKNGTMDSSQPTGTWNSYDLTFSNCDYVIENVVFEKAIAFDNANKAVTLKNVTINEDHDYYAMWITAAGQNVTVDGLTLKSPNGRGIKIDEQYVNESLAHVTLKVSNATFETKNKAAILVKSAAGAHITLNNVDIAKVEKDSDFAVWVDEDAAAYADKVVVDGGLCKVEGAAIAFAHSQEELNAAAVAGAYVYLAAGEYTLAKYPAGLTLVGAEDGVVFNATGKKYGVYGDVTIENAKVLFSNDNYTGFQHTNTQYFKNCTIVGQPFLYAEEAVFENCTFEQASASAYNVWTYGAKVVEFLGCTFNCAGKSVLIYTESGNGQNVTFNNCVLNASAPVEGKAAVEIDSSLIQGEYVVKINNTTDSGFATGNKSGKTLWNHKNGSKATVIVDGVTVEE